MNDTVGIIGYGRIGRALERIAMAAHRRVLVWDSAADRGTTAPSLEALVRASDLILLSVPSQAVRSVASSVAGTAAVDSVIISFAKGIEAGSGSTVDEVLEAAVGSAASWGVGGGPMLAEELLADRPGFLVLGATGRSATEHIQELFKGSSVQVSTTKDVHGVALGGVLKNVYVTLIGIASGARDIGSNAVGALTLAAQAELLEVGVALGGGKATLAGLAGVGDFLATALSPDSRNRQAGEAIARGDLSVVASEGCGSLQPLVTRLTREGIGMPPLLTALAHIMLRGAQPVAALQALVANLPIRQAGLRR